MWQHFHYFMGIAEACRRADGVCNKLKIILTMPVDFDQDSRPELEKPTQRFKLYVSLQIVVYVVLLVAIC